MIDDVEAFVSAAQILQERGAYKIYVIATHGLLSADAPRLIEDSPIHEVKQSDGVALSASLHHLNFKYGILIYSLIKSFDGQKRSSHLQHYKVWCLVCSWSNITPTTHLFWTNLMAGPDPIRGLSPTTTPILQTVYLDILLIFE